MAHRLISRLVLALIFMHFSEASVTVEKGGRAILECTGFVPNPEDGYENYAIFNWYKAMLLDRSTDNRVAVYDKSKGASSVWGDLQGRATVDGTSGALEITETRVTDDHYYTCSLDTASETVLKETKLIIIVTPSPRDLKLSGNREVLEGESATFTCQASEVKPPPQQMYLRFKDNDSPLTTVLKENVINADGLTWAVAVEYTLIANRIYQGKRLQCVFVTSTGESITSSEETGMHVLYKPMGIPSIQSSKASTKFNSTITLTCNTKGVDGSITYYRWQFANGTEIGRTTASILEYRTTSVGKVNIICIAGNIFGTTSKSEPLEVEIQDVDKSDLIIISKWTVVILGSLLGIFVCATITLTICLIYHCRRNAKKTSSNQSTTPDPHHYYEIDLQQQSAGHPVAPTDTATRPHSYVNSPAQVNSVSQGITTSINGHYTSLQK